MPTDSEPKFDERLLERMADKALYCRSLHGAGYEYNAYSRKCELALLPVNKLTNLLIHMIYVGLPTHAIMHVLSILSDCYIKL